MKVLGEAVMCFKMVNSSFKQSSNQAGVMQKVGKVLHRFLGCEPLFKPKRPDVMCHPLVKALSKHIWSL